MQKNIVMKIQVVLEPSEEGGYPSERQPHPFDETSARRIAENDRPVKPSMLAHILKQTRLTPDKFLELL